MENLVYVQIGMDRFTGTPCSGFLMFLTLYCFDPLRSRLRILNLYRFPPPFHTHIDCSPHSLFFNLKLNMYGHLMRQRV